MLIPCYKESLPITQRTVLAARRADKPAGTRVIIYICDDGADEAKADWVTLIKHQSLLNQKLMEPHVGKTKVLITYICNDGVHLHL